MGAPINAPIKCIKGGINVFKNRKPELKSLDLDKLIELAQTRGIVIVLKNGEHATFVTTGLKEIYLATNSGRSLALIGYNTDLTSSISSDFDIELVYGRKFGKSLFARDFDNVIYDAKSYMTFDQARALAGEHYVFKHECMPYYYNIRGVFEWMRNNRNIEYINNMLNEKKWTVLRTYCDPKLKEDK